MVTRSWSSSANERTTFLEQLFTQFRVIGALLLREVQLRYGREGLGAGWLMAEPLIFIFPVLAMWSMIRGRTEHDVPVMGLCWTGYLPLMIFRHLGGLMVRTLSNNAAVLYHRLVVPLDMLAAKILMEVGQNLLGLGFSFVVLYMLGELSEPVDFPMFLLGYFYMIWWCAAVGLLVAALSERSVWVEKIWFPLSYMYIAIGGTFYMADWLPSRVREVALFQPSLQAYEMIRAGMFGHRIVTYGEPMYAAAVLAFLTLVGLIFLRNVRRYIVVE